MKSAKRPLVTISEVLYRDFESTDTILVEVSKELQPKLKEVLDDYRKIPKDKRNDVLICVRKGHEVKDSYFENDLLTYPCSSMIISNNVTGSRKLRTLLQTNQSNSQENAKRRYSFSEVHEDMFTIIMTFIKRGRVEVRQVDVEELIDAAILFEIDELIKQCFKAMGAKMVPSKNVYCSTVAMRCRSKDLSDQCKIEMEELIKKCERVIQESIKKKKSVFLISHKECKQIWKLKEPAELEKVDKSVQEDIGSYNHSVCKYTDECIIFTGGVNCKVCLKWTATSTTWERLQDMICSRYDHASACLGDVLFVIGGTVDGEHKSASVHKIRLHVYNVDGEQKSVSEQKVRLHDPKWKKRPCLPIAMSGLKLASIGSKIYLLGNLDSTSKAGFFCLDSKRKDWLVKSGIWDAGSDFSLAACDSKLFVAGGSKKICKWYDPATDVWTDVTPPRNTHISASMIFYRSQMMILGGHSNIIEEYCLSEKSWKVSDVTLPQELESHTALVLDLDHV